MIRAIITDLDDTLYSWIGFFVPAFYEMLDEISRISGISQAILIDEYRTIHQQYGSTEYPFASIMLPSIRNKYGEKDDYLKEVLNPAFHRFNSVRKKKLQLFPDVYDTLHTLKQNQINILGYTESAKENAQFRLRKLGVNTFFSKVYVSPSNYKHSCYEDDILYENNALLIGSVTSKKPNPEVLKSICKKEGYASDEVIYCGDSITKDVYMAIKAGVVSVWCNYTGYRQNPELYDKLVAISHWTELDFQKEKSLKEEWEQQQLKPSFEIHDYKEIVSIVSALNRTETKEKNDFQKQ
jgi:phosphoglycolate phosphatase